MASGGIEKSLVDFARLVPPPPPAPPPAPPVPEVRFFPILAVGGKGDGLTGVAIGS